MRSNVGFCDALLVTRMIIEGGKNWEVRHFLYFYHKIKGMTRSNCWGDNAVLYYLDF